MYVQIRGFIHEGGESLRSLLERRERQLACGLARRRETDLESLRTWAVGWFVLGKALC